MSNCVGSGATGFQSRQGRCREPTAVASHDAPFPTHKTARVMAWVAAATVLGAGSLSQQPARLPRPAIVNPIARTEEMSRFATHQSFFDELARLGYEEGRNLTVERWSAEGKAERFREIAQQMEPDVVFAVSARHRMRRSRRLCSKCGRGPYCSDIFKLTFARAVQWRSMTSYIQPDH